MELWEANFEINLLSLSRGCEGLPGDCKKFKPVC